jgi:cyclophilin family peptidyl-prolyl cis-trans isomerase
MIAYRFLRSAAVLAACLTSLAAAPRPPANVDVAMTTSMGTIVVRLDAAHAPITVKNFLHYVDTHQFDGASFYRAVRTGSARPAGKPRIQIIQGGLQMKLGDAGIAQLPRIPVEETTKTGLHNTPGTIAMARERDPDTASTEVRRSSRVRRIRPGRARDGRREEDSAGARQGRPDDGRAADAPGDDHPHDARAVIVTPVPRSSG